MKKFNNFEIDFDQCQNELKALRELLARFDERTMTEREEVLSFFRVNRHIAALAGHFMPSIVNVDRLAYEFNLFGDYAADLVVGDFETASVLFRRIRECRAGQHLREGR